MTFSRVSFVLLLTISLAAASALAGEVKEAETDGVKLVLGSSKMPKMLGEMIPFVIRFEAPLKSGEKLTIFADTTHLAYQIAPKEGFMLREFRGRVRMNNGTLKAVIERSPEKKTEITQTITIDQPFAIPKTGEPAEIVWRTKGNILEVMHKNKMALTNYVKQMDINISGGTLTISMTPYSSGMAYFLIEGDSSVAGAKVEIQLADTPYQLTE